MTTELLLRGMHGLGDCIHERAIVRQWLARGARLWLETSWPSVFYDLVGERFSLVRKATPLRTQTKNAEREAAAFAPAPPASVPARGISYGIDAVRQIGNVAGAMAVSAGCDPAAVDFRLPIAPEWRALADALIDSWGASRPIMIFRPLVVRTEWRGCSTRNPDPVAYNALFRAVAARYYVVSIADLSPGAEWLAGPVVADRCYHAGELPFGMLAAIFARAALVFTAPGFAPILAQAVGAPYVCVFGGYQDARSLNGGAGLPPHLDIEPVNPCLCFAHCGERCPKTIDLARARARLDGFLDHARVT